MKLKNKLLQFMNNRYGYDELTRCLLIIVICIYSASLFLQIPQLILLCLLIILYIYFRIFFFFSYKRSIENRHYLNFIHKIKHSFHLFKLRNEQKKYYRFYHCPNCTQTIRIPKGHGKVEIKCPKCHHKFVKRS